MRTKQLFVFLKVGYGLLIGVAVLLVMLFTPSAVYADHCWDDPTNFADCMRTPGFRQVATLLGFTPALLSTILIARGKDTEFLKRFRATGGKVTKDLLEWVRSASENPTDGSEVPELRPASPPILRQRTPSIDDEDFEPDKASSPGSDLPAGSLVQAPVTNRQTLADSPALGETKIDSGPRHLEEALSRADPSLSQVLSGSAVQAVQPPPAPEPYTEVRSYKRAVEVLKGLINKQDGSNEYDRFIAQATEPHKLPLPPDPNDPPDVWLKYERNPYRNVMPVLEGMIGRTWTDPDTKDVYKVTGVSFGERKGESYDPNEETPNISVALEEVKTATSSGSSSGQSVQGGQPAQQPADQPKPADGKQQVDMPTKPDDAPKDKKTPAVNVPKPADLPKPVGVKPPAVPSKTTPEPDISVGGENTAQQPGGASGQPQGGKDATPGPGSIGGSDTTTGPVSQGGTETTTGPGSIDRTDTANNTVSQDATGTTTSTKTGASLNIGEGQELPKEVLEAIEKKTYSREEKDAIITVVKNLPRINIPQEDFAKLLNKLNQAENDGLITSEMRTKELKTLVDALSKGDKTAFNDRVQFLRKTMNLINDPKGRAGRVLKVIDTIKDIFSG